MNLTITIPYKRQYFLTKSGNQWLFMYALLLLLLFSTGKILHVCTSVTCSCTCSKYQAATYMQNVDTCMFHVICGNLGHFPCMLHACNKHVAIHEHALAGMYVHASHAPCMY